MQTINNFLLSAFFAVMIPFGIFSNPENPKMAVNAPSSANPEVIARGKLMYNTACAMCHGRNGDGKGPLSANLITQPRDFTKGVYKNRTTASGELPTDYDLYHTVTTGIHNTAMPPFKQMSAEDRWAVIQYIKTFSKKFLDSNEYPLEIADFGTSVSMSPQSLIKGREIYVRMKCAECHGIYGKGDGPAAGTHKDDFGNPIGTTDLTNISEYKFCHSVNDIFRIFSTGLNGAPMPSYVGTLNIEDRWHLANYVWALQTLDQYHDDIIK